MDLDKTNPPAIHPEHVPQPVYSTDRNLDDDDKKEATTHIEAVDSIDNKVDSIVNLAQHEAEQKYSPWTPSMWRLYGVLVVAYLCGCLNGYDGSLMGGINAMDSYQSFFKLCVAHPTCRDVLCI